MRRLGSVAPFRRRRRPVIAYGLALTSVVALTLAHLAGALGLVQAIRIGVAATGLISLAVAGRYLFALCAEPIAAIRREQAPLLATLAALARGALHGRRWKARRRKGPVGEVARLERLVRFSQTSAGDFHSLLRPRVSAVAARRLEDAGIDIADSRAVASALGPDGARLVDPLARPPDDRDDPGTPATVLLDVLRRLDTLG